MSIRILHILLCEFGESDAIENKFNESLFKILANIRCSFNQLFYIFVVIFLLSSFVVISVLFFCCCCPFSRFILLSMLLSDS